MAGDWIKMRVDLREDPDVISIATATDLDEDAVVGKLHRVWSWADQQTADGNAHSVTRAWLDRYVGVTGFASAMEKVGWLLVTDGGIQIPDFDAHNSESAKRRALTAKRAAKHRNAKRNATSVTKCAPREEKRREDIGSLREPLCPAGKQPDRSADVAAVVKHYRTYHPRALPNVTSKAKEYRQIVDRFKEGYTVADLCEAIDGCHKTPHNLGQNDRGTKYLDLELIVRSASHVNRFIENNRSPPKPPETSDDRPLDTSFKLPGEA